MFVESLWIFSFLLILFIILGMFFFFPFLFGAPFEPTKEEGVRNIIRLARVKKGEKVADLGSGDGRIVIALAKKGIEAHGFEFNPFLVLYSRLRIKREGLRGKAFIHWKNFWNVSFKDYDVVILFQFHTIMKKLKEKLQKELSKKSRVISYYWKFPCWKISKKIGKAYLYKLK